MIRVGQVAFPEHERSPAGRHQHAQGLDADVHLCKRQQPTAPVNGTRGRYSHNCEPTVGAVDDAVGYWACHHLAHAGCQTPLATRGPPQAIPLTATVSCSLYGQVAGLTKVRRPLMRGAARVATQCGIARAACLDPAASWAALLLLRTAERFALRKATG